MYWASFRHALGIIQTCFEHHPDMFWTSFRHVLGIIQTCIGHHADMFWASFRHVLGINQTCFGNQSDMFWGSSRHVLGVIWTCSGWFVWDFLNICFKSEQTFFRNMYFFKSLKNHQKIDQKTPIVSQGRGVGTLASANIQVHKAPGLPRPWGNVGAFWSIFNDFPDFWTNKDLWKMFLQI